MVVWERKKERRRGIYLMTTPARINDCLQYNDQAFLVNLFLLWNSYYIYENNLLLLNPHCHLLCFFYLAPVGNTWRSLSLRVISICSDPSDVVIKFNLLVLASLVMCQWYIIISHLRPIGTTVWKHHQQVQGSREHCCTWNMHNAPKHRDSIFEVECCNECNG